MMKSIEEKLVGRLVELVAHYNEIKEGDIALGHKIKEMIESVLAKEVSDVTTDEVFDLHYNSAITPFIQSEFVKIVCCIMELYTIASEYDLVDKIPESDRKIIMELVKYMDGYFMLQKEGDVIGFKSDVIKDAVVARSKAQFDGNIQEFYNSLKEQYEKVKNNGGKGENVHN